MCCAKQCKLHKTESQHLRYTLIYDIMNLLQSVFLYYAESTKDCKLFLVYLILYLSTFLSFSFLMFAEDNVLF